MAVFGDTLRQARAYKGVTLKEAEQATRINRHHLAALEEGNFGVLPPLIYQRGIIRNYATYLELDPGKLLAMFEEARGGGATTELVAAVKPLDMPNHWAPNFAIIAFMVVMSAIVFAWVYSATTGQPTATSTEAAAFPTVTPLPPDEQMAQILESPTGEAVAALGGGSATASPTVRVIPPEIAAAGRTPTPTARAVQTQTPRATATSRATATVVATATPVPPTPVPQSAFEPEPAPTEPPAQLAEAEQEQTTQGTGSLGITISPTAGIYLTITSSDGATLHDGWVEPGQTVGPLYADQFYVQTTDAAATLITNLNNGASFVMPSNEFSLP